LAIGGVVRDRLEPCGAQEGERARPSNGQLPHQTMSRKHDQARTLPDSAKCLLFRDLVSTQEISDHKSVVAIKDKRLGKTCRPAISS
jgi:hypothetical protein